MNKKITGAVLAMAVAALFASGQIMADSTQGKADNKVKCKGANSCKAKGECHAAKGQCGSASCGGHNSCKGKGWISVPSEAECTKQGGTVVKG